ncbi:MAG TPA: flavin reductase [Thermoleophilaceae bacterium]
MSESLRRLTPEEFRDVIGHFASGVTVATALHEGRPFGTTASAVSSLSLEPPMVLICMNRDSETGQAIASSGRFAINVLGENQADAAVRFARKGADKFEGVSVTPGEWGEPLLDEALATLECRVTETTAGGTHYVFLAEVDRASARAGTPLAYFRGEFGRLELSNNGAAARDRIQLARSLYEAFASADRPAVEELLSEDFAFSSPPDPSLDLAGYWQRCWPGAGTLASYDFVRLIEHGDELVVTYECTKADGKRFRNTEVLSFDGDKISRAEVYFGWDL